jgi:M6 family metalloprotease-like protein
MQEALMSISFSGQVFKFTQPDGSSLQVRGWGDQHQAVFETLDGYTVTRNPASGFYELARLSADGQHLQPVPGAASLPDGGRSTTPAGVRVAPAAARAAARQAASVLGRRRCDERRLERRQQRRAMRAAAAAGGIMLAPPQRTTVGDYIGLCLLIDFADSPQTIARDEVERFCNQAGYTGFGNAGSVHDYFADQSIGRCRYTNVVAPYYRARFAKTYYTDRNVAYGRRAQELIQEALAFHKAQGLDFTRLTADGRSFVYAMNVYYAGANVNNWSEGLWPHASALNQTVTLLPGKVARDYQFTAMGAELELGTFCHENGHMLCDYPDLYDYGNQSGGVGYYCLMCAGNHANPKNPVGISAYLKRLSGWAGLVTPLEHGKTVALQASGNQMAMLAKNDDEYFLIENRQKTGRDAALPDHGLAVWHVDETGSNNDEAMTAASHYELSLEQADGLFELERSRNELGDADDFYAGAMARFADDTQPSSRWWDGTPSFLTLDQISTSAATMNLRCSFANVVTPPAGGTIRLESAPNRAIPDNKATGISDTLQVADLANLADLKVGVAIAHSWRGDLEVRVVAPWGDGVVLHPKGQGGGADDLRQTFDAAGTPALAAWRGRPAAGPWRLEVRDLAASDTGRLERWWIELLPAGPAPGALVLEETPGAAIPDFPAAGIERSLQAVGAGQVAQVEVDIDILHSYVGDLRVVLVSPAGTAVTLHDRSGAQADNIVTSHTAATTPALAALAGQPMAGAWRLQVSDHEAQDVGKLRHWKLTLRR